MYFGINTISRTNLDLHRSKRPLSWLPYLRKPFGCSSKLALSYSDRNNSCVIYLNAFVTEETFGFAGLFRPFHGLNEAKNLKRSDIQETRSFFFCLGKRKIRNNN